MKTIETWQGCVFFGTLTVIAFIINGSQARRAAISPPPEAPQEAIRQKTPEELAADHAKYLARYLKSGFARKAGSETVAIVVGTQEGKLNTSLANALARRFASEKLETVSAVFTPEFLSDGLFDDAFGGSRTALSNLELKNLLDALLLARQTVQYSTNTTLQNVITANMGLEVVAFSLSTSGENQTWLFTANGAGFTPGEARALAEERLLKQISNDTKMSLNQVLPSK